VELFVVQVDTSTQLRHPAIGFTLGITVSTGEIPPVLTKELTQNTNAIRVLVDTIGYYLRHRHTSSPLHTCPSIHRLRGSGQALQVCRVAQT
jgi:hypothetical protein